MLKRIFNLSSPVGIALTAAGLILALSPQARRATRQLMVKGASMMLGTVESIKATAGVTVNMAEPAPAIGEGLLSGEADLHAENDAHAAHDVSHTKDDSHLNIGGMLGDAAETVMENVGKMGHKVQAGISNIVESVTSERPEAH